MTQQCYGVFYVALSMHPTVPSLFSELGFAWHGMLRTMRSLCTSCCRSQSWGKSPLRTRHIQSVPEATYISRNDLTTHVWLLLRCHAAGIAISKVRICADKEPILLWRIENSVRRGNHTLGSCGRPNAKSELGGPDPLLKIWVSAKLGEAASPAPSIAL